MRLTLHFARLNTAQLCRGGGVFHFSSQPTRGDTLCKHGVHNPDTQVLSLVCALDNWLGKRYPNSQQSAHTRIWQRIHVVMQIQVVFCCFTAGIVSCVERILSHGSVCFLLVGSMLCQYLLTQHLCTCMRVGGTASLPDSQDPCRGGCLKRFCFLALLD